MNEDLIGAIAKQEIDYTKRRCERPLVTHERLLSILHYDKATGLWTALVNRRKTRKGDHPGTLRPDGYIQLGVDGRLYTSHQLAWFYVTGEWSAEIDHWDLDRANNRWANLREATRSQNSMNKLPQSNNTSGFKGVSFCSQSKAKPWRAYINHGGKQVHLGLYASKEEARNAYAEAAVRLYGEFARAA